MGLKRQRKSRDRISSSFLLPPPAGSKFGVFSTPLRHPTVHLTRRTNATPAAAPEEDEAAVPRQARKPGLVTAANEPVALATSAIRLAAWRLSWAFLKKVFLKETSVKPATSLTYSQLLNCRVGN